MYISSTKVKSGFEKIRLQMKEKHLPEDGEKNKMASRDEDLNSKVVGDPGQSNYHNPIHKSELTSFFRRIEP